MASTKMEREIYATAVKTHIEQRFHKWCTGLNNASIVPILGAHDRDWLDPHDLSKKKKPETAF